MKNEEQRVVFLGGQIVGEDGVVANGALAVEGDRIAFVGTAEEYEAREAKDRAADRIVPVPRDGWVVPGFIDIHVHGGYGHDFMDANREAYDGITRFHASHGTTTMLATTVTASKEHIEKVLAAAADYRNTGTAGARLAGVHLEGPFISPKWTGAQNPAYVVPPNIGWLKEWTETYPDTIKVVTMAPEEEGALETVHWLSSHGIVASCGHTNAGYDQIEEAVDNGLSHAVHTFNAMKGIHHREPGTAGAVLTDDRISAEVIADGHHVHPACIRMLVRCKDCGKLLLVTDAMSAAGLGDGSYDLGGLAVSVENGVCRLKEGGNLAGSTLTMIGAFRFMVREVGLSVPKASRLASANPAKRIGLDAVAGSLAEGKRADLLVLNAALDLEQVWIRGREHRK